jgi:hypothetical protein
MSNVYALRAEGVKHAELREQIKQIGGLSDDDQTLLDTLEGASSYPELCGLVLREAKATEAMAEGLQSLIDDMQQRKARLLHRAKQYRATVAESMLNAGERKLTLPDMTVSVRMGKPRLIIDEGAIPDRYRVPHITFKTCKEAIQADVDKGDVPEGVQIANPQPVLTVRGS